MCIEELKEKQKQWREWFMGDDPHSICRQVYRMNWNSAVFFAVNEAWKMAPKDSEGGIKINGTLNSFIQHGFFLDYSLAVRRLMDKGTDVFSLRRLIDDLEKHQHLLTRKNLLVAEGLPYDYEKYFYNREEHTQEELHKAILSDSRHGNIDKLAGVRKDRRSPDDKVKPTLFPWLRNCLEYCMPIYKYVNKFFAHATTPESRKKAGADDIKITLGQIKETSKVICQVTHFVGLYFLNQSPSSFLPTPQFDQFKYLDQPLITQKQKEKLHKWWIKHDRKTSRDLNWNWIKEFNQFGKSVKKESTP